MGRKALEKERKDNPEKKQQWIAELRPYFMQNGLRNITMDDVAAQLGKSKATLYKYFKTNEEMVAGVVELQLAELSGFVPVLLDESAPYIERYRNAVEFMSVKLVEVSNQFLSDLREMYPHLWEMVDQYRDYSISILRSYYEQGKKEGVFNDVNTDIMVLSDYLFFDALTDAAYLTKNKLTVKQAFDEYFKMRFDGILSVRTPMEKTGSG